MKHLFTTLALLVGLCVWAMPQVQADDDAPVATKIYKVLFVLVIICGAIMTSSIAWDISDTFNGLMMIPNLIGVLAMSPLVMKLTKNYVDRKIKGKKDVDPMLSYDPSIQAENAKAIAENPSDDL